MIGRVTFHTLTHTALGDVAHLVQPYEDYGLLLVKYSAPPPEPRVYRVDIEGRNGSLDMTEWAGDVFYGDRTVNVTLRDMQGQADAFINKIAGRRVRICFDSDSPDWYFEGRCESINTNTRDHVTDIDMAFTCHPFRYPVYGGDDYKAAFSGVAYSGRRALIYTLEDDSETTAAITLHQSDESPVTVHVEGREDVEGSECVLTVNDVEYELDSNGTMAFTPILIPGENDIGITNQDNGHALTVTLTFGDRVI